MRQIMFILAALFLVAHAFAAISIVSPTPSNVTNQTSNIVLFNVTSTTLINVSGTSKTVLEWTNETGARLNLTPLQVVNNSAGQGRNYSFWNVSGLLDGIHRFKAYVWENTSNPIVVSTVVNVTKDATAPAVTINTPLNGDN